MGVSSESDLLSSKKMTLPHGPSRQEVRSSHPIEKFVYLLMFSLKDPGFIQKVVFYIL